MKVDRQLLEVVESMGRTWGWQWRKHFGPDVSVSIPSLLGRMRKEGFAALSGEKREQAYPEVFMGDALVFGCALKQVDECDREMAWLHYAVPLPAKVKAADLNIALRTYWQRRNRMRTSLVRAMDLR